MTLTLLPNTAALISRFLRDQDEVDDLVGQRVYTVLPKTKTFPLVRVSRVGGSNPTPTVHWLDAPLFQVGVWAETAAAAFEVAETCRAVLAQRFTGVHHFAEISGVVTGVNTGALFEGFDSTDPTKAFDRFDLVVFAHPARAAASA